MSTPIRPSRRTFLRTTTAAATALWTSAPAILRGQLGDNKLRIAVIGCGGRGADNLESVSGEQIVAICDVNRVTLDKVAAKHPNARKEVDFRKLYDHASEFDAVVVSTAEHTHAFATLPALQLKKHVYCEKPLTLQRLGGADHPRSCGQGRRRHADGHADPRRRQLPARRRARAVGRDWAGERGARLGGTRVGPAESGGRGCQQGHRLRHGSSREGRSDSCGTRLGSLAWPRAGASLQQRLRARAEMVSLVGFRQRHDERSRQPLERPAVLGAEAAARPRRSRPSVRRRTQRSRPRRCARTTSTGRAAISLR